MSPPGRVTSASMSKLFELPVIFHMNKPDDLMDRLLLDDFRKNQRLHKNLLLFDTKVMVQAETGQNRGASHDRGG